MTATARAVDSSRDPQIPGDRGSETNRLPGDLVTGTFGGHRGLAALGTQGRIAAENWRGNSDGIRSPRSVARPAAGPPPPPYKDWAGDADDWATEEGPHWDWSTLCHSAGDAHDSASPNWRIDVPVGLKAPGTEGLAGSARWGHIVRYVGFPGAIGGDV